MAVYSALPADLSEVGMAPCRRRYRVSTIPPCKSAPQEALVQAKEEAVRATKFKDQFLSTMSHELRTPLNAVLGFSDLLADERYGTLNDRQQRYVTHIHTGGTHLLKLITDILDLSKIEAGRMEIVREDCQHRIRICGSAQRPPTAGGQEIAGIGPAG